MQNDAAGLLLMTAAAIALTATGLVALTTGFFSSGSAASSLLRGGLMLVLLFATIAAAVVHAFGLAINKKETATWEGVGSLGAVALLLGAELAASAARVSPVLYLAISVTAHAVLTFTLTRVLIGLIRIRGRICWVVPATAGGIVTSIGVLGILSLNFSSYGRIHWLVMLARDVTILGSCGFVLGACALWKGLRLDPARPLRSLLLRLPSGADQILRPTAFYLILIGTTVNLILELGTSLISPEWTRLFGAFHLSWLGVTVLGWNAVAQYFYEKKQNDLTHKLTSRSARRFLQRHVSEGPAWAATVGLRTSNFSIDHDPGSYLHNQLPASIMQIRSEEIQRCVSEVLGSLYLHNHVVGHQVFGALDPEVSLHPCVDALKLFSCLYLDAGPLVERRIKGLASLLPIIDPGLSRILAKKDLSNLIRRNLWFFHFDYGWLDQHVIHTPKTTRYDVRIETLSSRVRNAMLDHLEKKGGVGNFIWVGADARNRLLQEAPAMRTIIEPCPVPAKAGSEELLMFIIKFEQLIPRLQRYFDLDSMRRTLLDFEPSEESRRLQNLIHLQISKAESSAEIVEVLGSITSIPWRGFREKDNALQLILAAYEKVGELSNQGGPQRRGGPSTESVQQQILDAVSQVGYPSQILHRAQINKIALRNLDTLLSTARDPRSPRFEESWMLLSTTEYGNHSNEQLIRILAFLEDAASRHRLASRQIVQFKSVDTLSSIARAGGQAITEAIQRTVNIMGHWIAREEIEPGTCCHFLDSFTFMQTHLKLEVSLDTALIQRLDSYFFSLGQQLGENHPDIISLMSRWNEFKQTAGSAAA